ncbi:MULTISPECIES: hypothetical protein [Flavobacteriales]|uniref:Uncharacterized protein n=3 Tax=Flavobacteriales TaxID=200644 RepID=A0A0B7HS65_9FLAO|nr:MULTISPECIES: hypothetical protein [Flavobacteriales]ATA77159.1 hypothetical protein CGC47_05970 [Capnocytophaga canimorsus]ATA93913.1 hypothetical protein CGC54_05985 [Capnocytophaga canimorsus]EKB61361.1 hypothetical protein HMPREF9700_00856 [Bergeyella zoohelcum CCUG 30536]MDT9499983.1 hypothetical protein [Capnocytophaga canimorsus]PJI83693.1 hypothetical protein CLV61_0298 [Capnocytophaga canimorsus]
MQFLLKILPSLLKIVACVYIIYIFIVEKGLRRHSPINWETLMMLGIMIWLVVIISDAWKDIKMQWQKRK